MEAFGIPPSHVICEIKEIIKNSILDGKIPNDREAAWRLMVELAHERGLELKR